MMEYQYAIYSFQTPAKAAAANAQMADLAAAGWTAHTALPNYSELAVFWHREVPDSKPVDIKRKKADVPALAKRLYETYSADAGGKSVHGEDLPSWEDVDGPVQEHWLAVAKAAAGE